MVGENVVPISPDDIRRPSGVTVMHISQSEVKVKLEPLVRRTFRLKPVLHGIPSPGYRVKKTAVAPPRITAEGPENVMKTLEGLQTMPIDIQGADTSMTIEPKIDYQGKSIKIIDTSISVRITIERVNR